MKASTKAQRDGALIADNISSRRMSSFYLGKDTVTLSFTDTRPLNDVNNCVLVIKYINYMIIKTHNFLHYSIHITIKQQCKPWYQCPALEALLPLLLAHSL